MTVIPVAVAAKKVHQPENPQYRDPIVQGFYGAVIHALEEAPDGASAATEITGEFHRHHHSAVQIQTAMTTDIRRLSADDAAKASMLAHASRTASRLLEETVRQAGRIHAHQGVESRMHDLAGQLDAAHPAIAEQIREILLEIAAPAPAATGPVVIASAVDTRWRVGWFKRSDRPQGALEPLPFAGWVLVAEAPDAPQQVVQSAFLLDGQWWTRDELTLRGMILDRMD